MPLELSLDISQPGAALHMMNWLIWPPDQGGDNPRRRIGLANHFLERKANLEKPETRERIRIFSDTAFQMTAIAMGLNPNGFETTSPVDDITVRHIEVARKEIEEELLSPAGGWPIIDKASWREEQEAIGRAVPPILTVGYALQLIFRMDTQDPLTFPPSLNRAMAIIKSGGLVSRTPRTLIDWWNERRMLAPLCAAFTIMMEQSHRRTGHPFALLLREQGLKELFGYAKFLRRFAVGLVPKHGKGPLIPDAEAVVYDVAAEELMPLLPPLTTAERKAARRPR